MKTLPKVINEFEHHNKESLRAILQEDSPIVDLSNLLSRPGFQLYEVHLVPQDEDAITQRFLEGACFNSAEQLLASYQFEVTDKKMHLIGIQARLVSDFGIGLSPHDAQFHFSLQRTKSGPVISVVFGSYRAMAVVYDRQLRSRISSTPQDEYSD